MRRKTEKTIVMFMLATVMASFGGCGTTVSEPDQVVEAEKPKETPVPVVMETATLTPTATPTATATAVSTATPTAVPTATATTGVTNQPTATTKPTARPTVSATVLPVIQPIVRKLSFKPASKSVKVGKKLKLGKYLKITKNRSGTPKIVYEFTKKKYKKYASLSSAGVLKAKKAGRKKVLYVRARAKDGSGKTA